MNFGTMGKSAAKAALGALPLLAIFWVGGCMASSESGAPVLSSQPSASRQHQAYAMNSAPPAPADAGQQPPKWPWRGVTLIDRGSEGAQPADIDMLVRDLGINSAHLYPNIKQTAKLGSFTPSQGWNSAMRWLDSMVAECKKDNIIAIVHLRWIPDRNGGFYDQTSSAYWNNPTAIDDTIQRVTQLAAHLHGYGSQYVAYDINSEPTERTSHGAVQPPGWVSIQKRIVEAIRSQDPEAWVVVKPGPWGGVPGYKNGFQPLPYPRLVYSVHMYAPPRYTHQGVRNSGVGVSYPGKFRGHAFNKSALEAYLAPVEAFQRENNVPMWVGEFSAVRWAPGSEQYLTDLVNIFDSYGWGWSYFSFGGWNGWDPRYDTSYTPLPAAAKSHYMGTKSQRWRTLEAMFGVGH